MVFVISLRLAELAHEYTKSCDPSVLQGFFRKVRNDHTHLQASRAYYPGILDQLANSDRRHLC